MVETGLPLLLRLRLHQGDLLRRQAVEPVDQPVDLRVRRRNLALHHRPLRLRERR